MKFGFDSAAFRRGLIWGVGLGLVLAVVSAMVELFKWDGTWVITFFGFAGYGYLGWRWSEESKTAAGGTWVGISAALGLAIPSVLIGVVGFVLGHLPVVAADLPGYLLRRLLLEVPYMAVAIMTARLHGTQNADATPPAK